MGYNFVDKGCQRWKFQGKIHNAERKIGLHEPAICTSRSCEKLKD